MNDQRYQQVKQAFYEVCSAAPGERGEALQRACDRDDDLRREVEQLLAVNEREHSFLRHPVMDDARFRDGAMGAARDAAASAASPHMIGRYRILRLVGEGGMGCVYEAEQESPQRRVALKVVRPMLHSLALMQRFEHEVRILGRLQHPGIAQIFEAGIADADPGDLEVQIACDAAADSAERRLRKRRPFFAMEFVDGQSLTHYAQRRGLSLDERLALLVRVCDAVHYGHQRGVVHRDLKPANILVCDDGTPKVIDFGVARATDADPMLTLHTEAGQMLGTLAYMSPEQVSGGNAQVDARSDVYALGVIGYELVSGRLPYDLAGHVAPEAARIIRDNEPSRLSSVSRNYRGDIETIFAKALAKEPARRYASAEALAADISRHLRDEPIVARPPTLSYQLVKFARRHKEFVAGLALVFIVLVGGIIGTSIALMKAKAAERVAVRQSHIAQRVSEVLQQILSYAKPGMSGGGRDVTVLEMLDQASEHFLGQLTDAPETELVARRTLGRTYQQLGQWTKASHNFERAVTLAQLVYGDDAPETFELNAEFLTMRFNCTAVHSETPAAFDVKATSVAMAEERLSRARQILGPKHMATQRLLMVAAVLRAQSYHVREGESHLRELLDITRSLPPEQRAFDEQIIRLRLASSLQWQHKWSEAEALVRELIASGIDGDEPRLYLTYLLADTQRLEESLAEMQPIFQRQQETFGDQHPFTLGSAEFLSALFIRMDRFEEALAMLEFQRHGYEATGANDEWIAYLLAYEAQVLDTLGRAAESQARFAQAIAGRRASHGDDFLAQEWWRGGVMRAGGLTAEWTGTALRSQAFRMIDDALMAHPTKDFAPDEIEWPLLQFVLTHWSGVSEVEIASGSFDDLKGTPDPDAGLYRLTLELHRRNAPPIHLQGWLLRAEWQLDLFRAFRMAFHPDEGFDWEPAILVGPHEQRSAPTLVLRDRYDDYFGPAGAPLHFGIHAATAITLPPGRYRFHAVIDDGARIWLDDRLVVDQWGDPKVHGRHHEFEAEFNGQERQMRIEYFQAGQAAMLWLWAEPIAPLEP